MGTIRSCVFVGLTGALLAACEPRPSEIPHPPTRGDLTAKERGAGWEQLFDGRTLMGWTTSADIHAWGVDNGELFVIRPGKGWWLRTDRMFRDFELHLEFRLPTKGNSGVGLRGSAAGDPAFTGMEVQILDDAGYSGLKDDQWCGSVYNAIPPLTQPAAVVFRPGEWNRYDIRLVGDTLNVWLNGVQIQRDAKLDERGYTHEPQNQNPLNARLPTGYISLQDHGDAVRFRNIWVKDLSADKDEGGWTDVFNGRDLAGLAPRGKAAWSVEDGVLVGRDGPGHLFTTAEFTDFELRALVRVNEWGNSGIYFRVRPKAEDPDTWPDGYEAQVDNHDPKNFTGCVYNRAWPDVKGPITRDGAWFDYRVRGEGEHIQTWINGRPMVDATLTDYSDGHIAFQSHHEGNVIMYKDVRVKRLK